MSLHPSCDGYREVAAPVPVFCCCVRASGPSGIALKAPSAFLASPCSRTSCYLEDQDSQEPASSSTFQISDYSWKYCKYVALERAKLSHWDVAAPHHRHLSEGVKAGRAVMVRVVSVPSTSHRLALSHREAPLAWLGFIPLALFYPSTFSLEICCPAGLLTWRKQMSALLFALKREPRRREGEGVCAL